MKKACLALLAEHAEDRGLVIVSLEAASDGPAHLEVLARLIEDPRCTLPVIALTDDVSESASEQALAAGAVDLIYRPLVAAYLFNRLDNMFPGLLVLPSTPASTMTLEDGSEVTFRMMTPSDAAIDGPLVGHRVA